MNRPGTSNGETDGKSRSSPKKRPAEGGGYRRPMAAILIISFIVMATVGAFALAEPDDCSEISGGTNDSSGDCGANLKWELKGTALTITGFGTMWDYPTTEYPAAPWGISVTSVTFVNSQWFYITSIGANAFKDCTNLESIDLSMSNNSRVSSIGANAFSGCTGLESVNLGTYITSIGEGAFNGCIALASIDTSTATSIGDNAFKGCTGLTDATIGAKVTTIGKEAFSGCTGLTSIDIPNSVTEIGTSAFYQCMNASSITIGSSVTTIGGFAFFYCGSATGIESVTIPSSVTSIGKSAFQFSGVKAVHFGDEFAADTIDDGTFGSCTRLETFTLPDCVRKIGANAFDWCEKLTSVGSLNKVTTIGKEAFAHSGLSGQVHISSDLISIGECAFADCRSVTNFEVDTKNPNYDYKNGVLFSKDMTTLIQYPAGKTSTTYAIPSSVTAIGAGAFYGCEDRLTSISILGDVTTIGKEAFRDCTGLTSIDIPDSVTDIGDYAFNGCIGLTSVTFGKNIKTVGTGAFSVWRDMKCVNTQFVAMGDKVVIFDGKTTEDDLKKLRGWEFEGNNESMKIVTEKTENGVKYKIDESSSDPSSSDKYVVYVNGCESDKISAVTAISAQMAFGHYKLSVTSIKDEAFKGCKTLEKVTIPDSVTSIGTSAFEGCTGLTSVTISGQITSIPESAFSGCEKLESVEIVDGSEIGSIEDNAFYGCKKLSFVIPGSVTSIGDNAFYGCEGLGSIDISNVVELGSSAFYGCTGLTSVTFGSLLQTITDNAFYGCTSLTSIDIPKNIMTIDYSAFQGCSCLEFVTFEDPTESMLSTIESSAFEGCEKLASVAFPDSVTSIKARAFAGCDGLKSVTFGDSPESLLESIAENAFCDSNGTNTKFYDVYGNELTFDDIIQRFKGQEFTGDISVMTAKVPGIYCYEGVVYKYDVDTGEAFVLGFNEPTLKGDTKILDSFYTEGMTFRVTSIGEKAFNNCTKLTSVTIPGSIGTIGKSAFEGCENMTSVEISDGVAAIEENAFYGCKELTSVTIPGSVGTIGKSAFEGCEKMESVEISDGVAAIEEKAFYGCKELTSITIPGSVGTIGKSAFEGCEKMESVEISDGVAAIEEKAFYGCKELTSITIPGSVGTIGKSAFEGCEKMESVEISDGIAAIDGRVFYGCKALTSITIPDSVETIGEKAFGGCDGLTAIHFGNGVTEIAEDAFCSSAGTSTKFNDEFSKQIFPSSDIGKFRGQTFKGDISVMSLETLGYCIIDGVIYVVPLSGEAYVYGYTEDIKSETVIQGSVTIDGVTYNVTSIGAGAFEDCTKLTSITIPDSVKDIKEYAFLNCTGLETVSFGTGIESVDPNAFSSGKKGGDIVPTAFYDENLDQIDLSSQTEKLRGEMFKGDIYKMTVTRTITIDDGTSTWTYTGCVGEEIPRPADPTKDGYAFQYWADEDGNVFDWIVPAKNIKVTAVWKSVSPSGDDDDDYDDDDDPPYTPSGKDSGNTNGSDSDSAKILIIVACIAAFMAILAAYVCSNKR